MEYGLSTYLYVEERLNSHILDKILAAGIRNIELFAAASTSTTPTGTRCAMWLSGFATIR